MFETVLSENAKKSLAILGKSGLGNFSKVDIANVKDIAAMKIAAIADRGSKKDFIDLYFVIKMEKILSLKECLGLYDKKFKVLKQNKAHILKSLDYFDDADKEANLKMIKNVKWKEAQNVGLPMSHKMSHKI